MPFVVSLIVRGDLRDVRDVERTVVREVEVNLTVGGDRFSVLTELGVDREDVVEVRHRLLTIRRADLAPPDVHIFLVTLLVPEPRRIREEDGQMLVHRVGFVRRIPDGDEVPL